MGLTIRRLTLDDLETTYQYASDVENTYYMLKNPDASLAETKSYLEKCIAEYRKDAPEYLAFAVVLDGVHIGEVFAYLGKGFADIGNGFADIGWVINKEFWGHRYAAQAALLMVEELRESLGIQRFIAYCDRRNVPSQRVMEQIGMRSAGLNGMRHYDRDLSQEYEMTYVMAPGRTTIKPMETEGEIFGKGYVHWKSWQEAYHGLISQDFLDRLTLEKCIQMARKWPDDVLVAKDVDTDTVVGFVAYGACRDGTQDADLEEARNADLGTQDADLEEQDATQPAGEIYAIYVLEPYYGTGVGVDLMRAATERLSKYAKTVVWVLKGNERAIHFYQKHGFRFDGAEQNIVLGAEVTELRMVREK